VAAVALREALQLGDPGTVERQALRTVVFEFRILAQVRFSVGVPAFAQSKPGPSWRT